MNCGNPLHPGFVPKCEPLTIDPQGSGDCLIWRLWIPVMRLIDFAADAPTCAAVSVLR
jgi:hypothetical protein